MFASKMNALALACAMLLAVAHTTLAQNTPEDYVDSHNVARSTVGVDNVSWNSTLQAYSEDYANQRITDCQLIHSDGPYGENIFWGSDASYSGVDAVNSWVSEKQYYDYSTNSCATGEVCGHYTQVVWSSSTQIGCARVVCDNDAGIFIICSYYLPGNYIGESPY